MIKIKNLLKLKIVYFKLKFKYIKTKIVSFKN